MTVLDLQSPEIRSVYVALRLDTRVVATDLSDYFYCEYDTYSRVALRDGDRCSVSTQDGRALTYPDASFDRVFRCPSSNAA